MINVRKLVKVSKLADKESASLASSFRRNNFVNTVSRTKLFKEEEKLQKLREETFSGLAKALGEKDKDGLSGALLGVLGIGGAGRIVRRFRGGGGGGFPGGGGVPKLPKGPLAKSLSKFGRIGPLAIASTGLDFFSRKQSGQSNLQAGGGALAGLGGFAGGAKLGALLGTAILPGVGTAAGGLIGGALGGLMGGNLFDRLYGQNRLRAGSDFRRIEEIERTRQGDSLFSENLDKFDKVLEKFEKVAPRIREDENDNKIIAERVKKFTEGVQVKKEPKNMKGDAVLSILDTVFGILAIAEVVGLKKPPTKSLALRTLVKTYIKNRKVRATSGFLKFSKDANKIKIPKVIKFPNIKERIAAGFKRNFPTGFKPNLSRKGIQIREQVRLTKELKLLEKKIPEFEIFDFLKKVNLQSPTLLKSNLNKAYNKNYEAIMNAYKKIKNPNIMDEIKMLEKVDKLRKTYDLEILRIRRYESEVKQIFEGFKNIKVDSPQADSLFKGLFRDINKIPKKFPKLKDKLFINKEGGVMSGPETGYLAVLHGRERIIPEENEYTRSRGSAQSMKTNTIMMIQNNNNNQQPSGMMQTPKTQVVPIFVPADPFDVATKYSELIAKVTV